MEQVHKKYCLLVDIGQCLLGIPPVPLSGSFYFIFNLKLFSIINGAISMSNNAVCLNNTLYRSPFHKRPIGIPRPTKFYYDILISSFDTRIFYPNAQFFLSRKNGKNFLIELGLPPYPPWNQRQPLEILIFSLPCSR